jgi:hypothetical protein
MLFILMYLIGLSIGLVIYALTYLFTRELNNYTRIIVVGAAAALTLVASLTLIGGFAGMPFGVLSLGMFTTSILFAFFEKSVLWKKAVSTLVILLVVSYSTFMYLNQVDFWIVKKTHFDSDYEIASYMQQLQNDTSIKGFKTFTISEGNKGIVLSLGGKMAGNNIEVLKVEDTGSTTQIMIRTFYNQSVEKNPVIMIGLDRLQPEIVIMDTDGTIYEEVK